MGKLTISSAVPRQEIRTALMKGAFVFFLSSSSKIQPLGSCCDAGISALKWGAESLHIGLLRICSLSCWNFWVNSSYIVKNNWSLTPRFWQFASPGNAFSFYLGELALDVPTVCPSLLRLDLLIFFINFTPGIKTCKH